MRMKIIVRYSIFFYLSICKLSLSKEKKRKEKKRKEKRTNRSICYGKISKKKNIKMNYYEKYFEICYINERFFP